MESYIGISLEYFLLPPWTPNPNLQRMEERDTVTLVQFTQCKCLELSNEGARRHSASVKTEHTASHYFSSLSNLLLKKKYNFSPLLKIVWNTGFSRNKLSKKKERP